MAPFAVAARVTVGALVAQLGRRLDDRADRRERERAADRHAADAERAELGDRRHPGENEHVDRPLDGLEHRLDLVSAAQARREQHVGAGLLEGAQAGDRVVEIVAPADQVLAARGQDHVRRALVCDLGGGGDALGGERELVDRAGRAAAVVLDREARQAGRDGAGGGLGDVLGAVGEAVLEVGRHRQLGRRGDRRGVRERLVAGHGSVQAAERRGETAAGRRERLEAQRGEQPRGADVPRIGHQQRRAGPMQREEPLGALCLLVWLHSARIPRSSFIHDMPSLHRAPKRAR